MIVEIILLSVCVTLNNLSSGLIEFTFLGLPNFYSIYFARNKRPKGTTTDPIIMKINEVTERL